MKNLPYKNITRHFWKTTVQIKPKGRKMKKAIQIKNMGVCYHPVLIIKPAGSLSGREEYITYHHIDWWTQDPSVKIGSPSLQGSFLHAYPWDISSQRAAGGRKKVRHEIQVYSTCNWKTLCVDIALTGFSIRFHWGAHLDLSENFIVSYGHF